MKDFKKFVLFAVWGGVNLAGCGGGDGGTPAAPPLVTTQIQSDPAFDGDIEQTSATSYVVTQGMTSTVQSVFAGIDPVAGTEFRAFLDFPLSGTAGIPANAIIHSAFLDIQINSLQPATGTLPLLIELVSFQPPTLIGTDFDQAVQPALASLVVSPPIGPADNGTNVSIDITPLMTEAQRLGFVDFQLRVMEDLGPAIPVLLEINDTTGPNRNSVGPTLTVNYF